MGVEAKANGTTSIEKTLKTEDYWKLRAVIGDVERAQVVVQQAQAQLQQHLERRQTLLKAAAGDGIDLNFLSHIDWHDDTCVIILHRVMKADPPKIE